MTPKQELTGLKKVLYRGNLLRHETPDTVRLWERFDCLLKMLYP